MIRTRIFLALLLSVTLASMNLKSQGEGGTASEKKPEAVQTEKKTPPKPYQLAITIKEIEGNKIVYEKSYSLTVIADPNHRDYESVRDGERIPFHNEKGSDYFDSGTNIDVNATSYFGDFVTTNIGVARSVLADKPDGVNLPLLKQWKVSVTAAMLPGKSTVIYSENDSSTGHKVVIEATVTAIEAK